MRSDEENIDRGNLVPKQLKVDGLTVKQLRGDIGVVITNVILLTRHKCQSCHQS